MVQGDNHKIWMGWDSRDPNVRMVHRCGKEFPRFSRLFRIMLVSRLVEEIRFNSRRIPCATQSLWNPSSLQYIS